MVKNKGISALLPLIALVALYLVTSIVADDFYAVPLTVAFLGASVLAVAMTQDRPVIKRVELFSRGAGQPAVMLMIWIFVLAGAFATAAERMGCIDATVSMTLHLLPGGMLYAGLFSAACAVSISIGTSVGTIVALTPIAIGAAASTGADLPTVVAVVVGGSFFGDNLSFISDTTIVATNTQGCRMGDKFRVNSMIAMPVALIVFIVYAVIGADIPPASDLGQVRWLKILPYAVVLVTAVLGMNVLAVLTLGLLLTGAIGRADGSLNFLTWLRAMGDGITSMGELIIITMLAGGLLELIRANGGIDFIITAITKRVNSKRGAELAVAALVSMVNVCTANNTVAILTVGDIAKKIGDRFGVDNRKNASLLDTFSCCVQGVLPYGAQVLMAAGLAHISPAEIIPHLYYPAALGLAALLSILLRYPKRYS